MEDFTTCNESKIRNTFKQTSKYCVFVDKCEIYVRSFARQSKIKKDDC